MPSLRRTPRATAVKASLPALAAAALALAGVALVLAAPAVASHGARHAPAAPARSGGVPQLVFPVAGPASAVVFRDDFGDPRAHWAHPGNDLVAAKRAPVLAVEGGTVRTYTRSASAGCMLYLYGDSGTMYEYIHLNNDLTAANDNRGGCTGGVAWPAALRDGMHVEAGQLIGFVGDSGDASGAHAHLHFEIHPGGGAAVSPYAWLVAAKRLAAPGGPAVALAAPVAAAAAAAGR